MTEHAFNAAVRRHGFRLTPPSSAFDEHDGRPVPIGPVAWRRATFRARLEMLLEARREHRAAVARQARAGSAAGVAA